jgi:RNA polymerase sigma-70 factor (ECF subfamily)
MNEVYERNVDRMYRICFMYLKNSTDAEDAVQSIFLKLFKSEMSFRDLEHEKAWLIVTARNHCKDMLKSWWRTRHVDMAVLPEGIWHDDREGSGVVLDKLLALPAKYRIVLYLYYYEDYSVREISTMLDRKESTVQTQLAKGRELMKLSLGGHYEQ